MATRKSPEAVSAGTFDELAHDLQQLRLEAGAVSYTELATRVTRQREERGLSPAAARVARSSVYDVFRPGRVRLNAELVADIVRALGRPEDEASAWQARAAAARLEGARPRAPRAAAPGRDVALVVIVCVAAVGVNLILNFTVSKVGIPIYLDMVGTALASFAFGPWVGAIVGIATNVGGNAMNADFSGWGFAFVQVAGAVVWGYGFRRWFGRGRLRFQLLNAVAAVVCSLVAVTVILVFFGGVSTATTMAAFAETLQRLGSSMVGAVFSVNMLTSIVDKVLSGSIALALLWLLVRQGFPVGDGVRTRLGTAEPSFRL